MIWIVVISSFSSFTIYLMIITQLRGMFYLEDISDWIQNLNSRPLSLKTNLDSLDCSLQLLF